MSSGKAPGSDAIPAKMYKAGSSPVAEKLTVISHYVEKRSHLSRIYSGMHQLSTYSNVNVVLYILSILSLLMNSWHNKSLLKH